jgi:hypothetical protein
LKQDFHLAEGALRSWGPGDDPGVDGPEE